MFFAAYDYFRYRSGTGRYSPEAIRKQGGVLASPELENIANCMTPGNILFLHTRNSFLSWMVMYYTDSLWSHTGMIADNRNIIDATTSGVIEHPFSDYLDGRSFICIYKLRGDMTRPTLRM